MEIAIVFFVLTAVIGELFIYNGTDDRPCIMLNVEGVFTVTAENDKNEESSASVNISDTKYTVTGLCSPWNASLHEMTIHFDRNVTWNMTFIKNGDIDTVSLVHTFSFNANKLNSTWPPSDLAFTSSEPGLNIHYNHSYLCNAQQFMRLTSNDSVRGNFTFSVSLAFSKLHIQAFNVIDGKFSQDEECVQDGINATTAGTTTKEITTSGSSTAKPSPATTSTAVRHTQPSPPIEPLEVTKYVVHDENSTVCIYFTSIIGFKNLTFTHENERKSQDVFIPLISNFTTDKNVIANGTCSFKNEKSNKTQSKLVIVFNKNWTLSLVFEEDSDVSKVASYSLKEIYFTYFWDSDIFNGVDDPGHPVSVNTTNISDVLKTSLPGSYKCNSELTYDIGGGISMQTKKLQCKAFGKSKMEDFTDEHNLSQTWEGSLQADPELKLEMQGVKSIFGLLRCTSKKSPCDVCQYYVVSAVSQCSADYEGNVIVPIAVGVSIAGFTAIELITYNIVSYRIRRADY